MHALPARLTGFKIDIKSETQARESGDFYDYDEDDDEYYEDDEYESLRSPLQKKFLRIAKKQLPVKSLEETEDAVENEDEE